MHALNLFPIFLNEIYHLLLLVRQNFYPSKPLRVILWLSIHLFLICKSVEEQQLTLILFILTATKFINGQNWDSDKFTDFQKHMTFSS